MLTSTTISSLAFLLIAVASWYMAGDYTEMGSFFPRVIAVILGIFSMLQLIVSLIQKKREKPFEGVEPRRLFVMIAGIVSFLALMILVGFVPSSVIFLSFFFWFLSRGTEKSRSLLSSVTLAVLICAGFYAVFYYVFDVPLPVGILFDW